GADGYQAAAAGAETRVHRLEGVEDGRITEEVWDRVITGEDQIEAAAVVMEGLAHVTDRERDAQMPCRGFFLGTRDGCWGPIRGSDLKAQAGQAQRLGANAARNIKERGDPLPPPGSDDTAEAFRLPRDTGFPVFINQVIKG